MPIYVYQCNRCDVRSEVFHRSLASAERAGRLSCDACGSPAVERVFTPFAIYRSEQDRLAQIDPKYYKMVDQAITNTPEAEPMRHLSRMMPFDAARDPGEPIKF